ncbi:MAG: hypothetical protein ACLQL2_01465 [Methylovirgula sp.]
MPQRSFSILFRSDQGEIDAPTWWRGIFLLAGVFAVLTLGWFFIEPFADKTLATTVASTIIVLTANLYRIAYGVICLLLLICFYNLSAKRWRNLGRPASFAGILPIIGAIAAALHWLEPRTGGDTPHLLVIAADLLAFAVLIWNVVELGGIARFRV